MEPREKRLTEATREMSESLLGRRKPLPSKQDRPQAPEIKWVAERTEVESLAEFASQAGAEVAERRGVDARTEACLIAAEDIVLDERVRWKCIIPLCFGYGSSPTCPPYSPSVEEMRVIVSKYQYGVFLRYMPPVESHVYPQFLSESAARVNELNEIVGMVEVEAGYRGFHLAMGFKGGPCCLCGRFSPKHVTDWFQGKNVPRCPVLEGNMCYHYLQPRPALEACGVDVFATSKKVGWTTYLVLPEYPAQSIPCVSWYGLVLVI